MVRGTSEMEMLDGWPWHHPYAAAIVHSLIKAMAAEYGEHTLYMTTVMVGVVSLDSVGCLIDWKKKKKKNSCFEAEDSCSTAGAALFGSATVHGCCPCGRLVFYICFGGIARKAMIVSPS